MFFETPKINCQNQVLKYSKMLVVESRYWCIRVLIVKLFQLYYIFEIFIMKYEGMKKPYYLSETIICVEV